jgi:hypothetical protein
MRSLLSGTGFEQRPSEIHKGFSESSCRAFVLSQHYLVLHAVPAAAQAELASMARAIGGEVDGTGGKADAQANDPEGSMLISQFFGMVHVRSFQMRIRAGFLTIFGSIHRYQHRRPVSERWQRRLEFPLPLPISMLPRQRLTDYESTSVCRANTGFHGAIRSLQTCRPSNRFPLTAVDSKLMLHTRRLDRFIKFWFRLWFARVRIFACNARDMHVFETRRVGRIHGAALRIQYQSKRARADVAKLDCLEFFPVCIANTAQD